MRIINNIIEAERLREILDEQEGPFGLDCETVGVDPRNESPVGKGKIVCYSIAWNVANDQTKTESAFLWARSLVWMSSWLKKAPVIGHNIHSFDYHMFKNRGIELNIHADTLRMSKLIKADSKRTKHGLKPLMEHYLGYKSNSYSDLFSRPVRLKVEVREKSTYSWRKINGLRVRTYLAEGDHHRFSPTARELIPLDTIASDYPERLDTLYEYATLDAVATLELYHLMKAKLETMECPTFGDFMKECGDPPFQY